MLTDKEQKIIDQDVKKCVFSYQKSFYYNKIKGIKYKVPSMSKIFPDLKKELWGGEFWEDGYFVRTVGDKVTAEVIRKYIRLRWPLKVKTELSGFSVYYKNVVLD